MKSDVLEKEISFKSPKTRYIAYALAAMVLSILHVVLLDLISVGGMTPDFLVILCVIIALREGQFVGLIAGFTIGLFFDIVSFDLIGTNALAKTLVGFFAGYFYKEGFFEQTIGGLKLLFLVFFSNLLNNLVYYLIFIKPSEISFLQFFLRYGLAMSFYTTVFAVFVMLLKYKRKE
jgi:rod shape-determining protein MreD